MTEILQPQLDFLINLAHNRPGLLNPFFIFLSYLDTYYFIFLLIPTIWLGFSWRWGVRLFYLIITSALTNFLLKNYFQLTRPLSDLPDLALIHLKSFSFPSGAAQNSFVLAGLLIYAIRSKWAVILGVCYALLMGFSRLYLGVHYPTDILGGFFVGLILLTLFIISHRTLENLIGRHPYWSLGIAVFIPLKIILLFPNISTILYLTAFIAVSIGVFFSLFYGLYLENPKKLSSSLARIFIGAAGLFLLYFSIELGFKPYFSTPIVVALSSLAIGLWTALGSSPLIKLLIPKSKWMHHTQ